MSTNTSESPIVTTPVADSPIVNSPIVNSPIVNSAIINDEPVPDFNDACAAGMPAGHRMFYFKFVAIVIAVLGTLVFGIYKLLMHLGF